MFLPNRTAQVVRRRRKPARVPRDLSPRLMRDIGLDPWPEEPHRVPVPRW